MVYSLYTLLVRRLQTFVVDWYDRYVDFANLEVLLTGSPLMYHESWVEGLDFCAVQMRSAVSPTWYCFRLLWIDGPSLGKSGSNKSVPPDLTFFHI